MKNLIALNKDETVSTIQLRSAINKLRKEAGESAIQNNHFITRIEDELEGELPNVKFLQSQRGGLPAKFYDLTLEQASRKADLRHD